MRIAYSLIASITRWIQYTILDKLLVKVPIGVFGFISSIFNIIFRTIVFYAGNYSTNFKKYFADKNTIRIIILTMVLYTLANTLILLAIKDKNATVASLIEISYPIFVVLFTYLFYKNINLNLWTIIWWILILWGIAFVYLYNK